MPHRDLCAAFDLCCAGIVTGLGCGSSCLLLNSHFSYINVSVASAALTRVSQCHAMLNMPLTLMHFCWDAATLLRALGTASVPCFVQANSSRTVLGHSER